MRMRKTFTGCWTCRARRLKCNEARPYCLQCLTKGLRCEGYSTRLQWLPPMSSALTLQQHEEPLAHEKRQQHRRRLLLAPDLALLSERELETALSDIDRAGLQLQSATSGPFSVFAVTTTVHDAAVPSAVTPALSSDTMTPDFATKCFDTLASPSDDSPEAQWQTDSLSAISVRSQPAGDEHGNPKTQSSPSTPYLVHVSNATDNPLGVPVIAAGHILEQPVASETVVDPPSLSSSRDAEAPQQSTHPRPQPYVVRLSHAAASDPRSGFLTPNVRFLLQNYADNVVPILGTLDTSHNPWKEVHLPHAMLCSIELDILGHSTRSKRALLHTILAVSAYNINNMRSRTAEDTDSRKWSYLASDYKCQALSLLEACVGASQGTLDFPVYNEILAAMLSMVTIDVSSKIGPRALLLPRVAIA
ncbi:hypothetical protein N8I77_007084 [Diaporthe amygdali]|uniref:Zn(2)-C6 fungal-type domain-containing protein n=1 Tax=Phomopsis amygdali TaxID=1214568 RepID=A0AAD9SC65_PHOAM|nr:hypothetical protein N8I77_007084 [Diaporthe amygdali]